MSRRRRDRLTRWILRLQGSWLPCPNERGIPSAGGLVSVHFEALRPTAFSTRCLSLPTTSLCTRDAKTTRLAIDLGFGHSMVRRRRWRRVRCRGDRSYQSSKLTLQSDELSPEAVALSLELDDALTKLPVLDERLGCIGGVNESGRSLAFAGAVGAHPLGVGRPLPRSARSPL